MGRHTRGGVYLSPTVLTSSGGHQNTYSRQAGGTHTGMLSCVNLAFIGKLS